MKLEHIALQVEIEKPNIDDGDALYWLLVKSFAPFNYSVTTADISRTTALANLQDAILLTLEEDPLTQEQIDLIYANIVVAESTGLEAHGYNVFVADGVAIPKLSDELLQKSKMTFNRRLWDLKHQITEQYIHDNALDVNR